MKEWYLSKTLWVFLILFIGSILVATKTVNLELSADAAWVGIALSIVAMILRFLTGKEIGK